MIIVNYANGTILLTRNKTMWILNIANQSENSFRVDNKENIHVYEQMNENYRSQY